jgi:hypothetical protein
LKTAQTNFESGFALYRNGQDAEVFIQCLDVASTPFCDGRIAALSLFANVVIGLKANIHEFLSLNSMRRLLTILDAAHAAGDIPVVEGSLAVIWNIAASAGDTEKLITQVRLHICGTRIILISDQVCPSLMQSTVKAAHSSPKSLQYSLGVRQCCAFVGSTTSNTLYFDIVIVDIQVFWCITAFEKLMDEDLCCAGGVALVIDALRSRCERTLLYSLFHALYFLLFYEISRLFVDMRAVQFGTWLPVRIQLSCPI